MDPKEGRLNWTPVLAFLDRRPDEVAEYITLKTASNTSLRLSSNHVLLIPQKKLIKDEDQAFTYESRYHNPNSTRKILAYLNIKVHGQIFEELVAWFQEGK